MGSIGDCFDNSMVESFFATLRLELLDRQDWATRAELARAIFEYIEAWYNPRRRHSTLGMLSPYSTNRHMPHRSRRDTPEPSGKPGKLRCGETVEHVRRPLQMIVNYGARVAPRSSGA